MEVSSARVRFWSGPSRAGARHLTPHAWSLWSTAKADKSSLNHAKPILLITNAHSDDASIKTEANSGNNLHWNDSADAVRLGLHELLQGQTEPTKSNCLRQASLLFSRWVTPTLSKFQVFWLSQDLPIYTKRDGFSIRESRRDGARERVVSTPVHVRILYLSR